MVNPQALTDLLSALIESKVAADASRQIAIIGFVGVAVGALIGVGGTLLLHWLQSRPKRALDKQRASLLIAMLEDDRFPNRWRHISTLARVIGASDATTTRLLISVGARGSEKNDGMWGLIKNHPLDQTGE
jgi:hypothetical protein